MIEMEEERCLLKDVCVVMMMRESVPIEEGIGVLLHTQDDDDATT